VWEGTHFDLLDDMLLLAWAPGSTGTVEEIDRYKRFKRMMFGIDKIEEKIRKETDDIDFKTYAKYLLKEGTIIDKRELLSNLN
jgi:hypothetical protein